MINKNVSQFHSLTLLKWLGSNVSDPENNYQKRQGLSCLRSFGPVFAQEGANQLEHFP